MGFARSAPSAVITLHPNPNNPQAIANDDVENTTAKTSTVVDDAFFIFSKCTRCDYILCLIVAPGCFCDLDMIAPLIVRRAMATGSTDCVCAMLNHIGTALSGPVMTYFSSRVDSAFKSG